METFEKIMSGLLLAVLIFLAALIFEAADKEGRALELPGVDVPTEKKEVRFRKGK